MAASFQITIDCEDAAAMSRFWSTALGYIEEPPPAGYLSWPDFLRANNVPLPAQGAIGAICDPERSGPRVLFLRAPETKSAKSCIHLDIRAGHTDGEKGAKIAELVAAGATVIRRVDEDDQWWMVMADPEGNEFCVT